jgi:hypothetical protein
MHPRFNQKKLDTVMDGWSLSIIFHHIYKLDYASSYYYFTLVTNVANCFAVFFTSILQIQYMYIVLLYTYIRRDSVKGGIRSTVQ